MQLSMFQALIPQSIAGLNNLSNILTKGQEYATLKKIEPEILVNARLAPDMFAFARQIQITTDIIKGGAARLAGVEIPSYPDTETTFEQLQTRIKNTVKFLQSLAPNQIDGSEEKQITLKVGGNELQFLGRPYLLSFVLPNFYFHISMAYAILRHNGVPIGKMDFLGAL